jgi:hypothetical protein
MLAPREPYGGPGKTRHWSIPARSACYRPAHCKPAHNGDNADGANMAMLALTKSLDHDVRHTQSARWSFTTPLACIMA